MSMLTKLIRALLTGSVVLGLGIARAEAQSSTTIEPFGSGYIINRPGQPSTTVMPFGSGWITNTPGQPSTTIQPFGSGWIVNTPDRGTPCSSAASCKSPSTGQ